MTTSLFSRRYAGTRWMLRYGTYAGMEKHAVNALQRTAQAMVPYVIEARPADDRQGLEETHQLLIGTVENNPLLRELVARELLTAPTQPEGYTIACLRSPWGEQTRLLAVLGTDAKGVLNGVHALNAQVLAVSQEYRGNALTLDNDIETVQYFTHTEHPRVSRRGIWTWGYVIYDYRGFLDNMARLRMNLLVVWNDCPPVNAPELVAYAHELGIQVIFGYHWGWGLKDLDPANPEHKAKIKAEVVEKFQQDYRHLGADGLYFQTFTEHHEKEMGGKTVAAWACEWVNEISTALWALEPELEILFGLHATSIAERYTDLTGLDPRVIIMWEDAGQVPFGYYPDIAVEKPLFMAGDTPIRDADATLAYAKQLVHFRGKTAFSMVPKGFSWLRWDSEFENHGPFILGERSPAFRHHRLDSLQPVWDRHNAMWFRHYPFATRFYREILDLEPAGMSVAALIEDGLFEERIQPCVSLYAEMLWNPYREDGDILAQAMSPYYLAP